VSGRDKGQLISGWTRQHARISALVATTVAGGALAVQERWPFSLIVCATVLGTVTAALFVDAFGGIVVGVAGAAIVIAVKRAAGDWTVDGFLVSLGTTVTLVAGAWLAGLVSSDLHGRTPRSSYEDEVLSPAYGSLGLLDCDAAMARLEEEIARANAHHRPLSVAVVEVRLNEAALDETARRSAERAVARLMETLVRDTDVPFAVRPHVLGVIMPEADRGMAWEVLGRVLDAATDAAFTVRERNERLKLGDCAELHAGIVALSKKIPTAEKLIETARRSSSSGTAAV
jgi:hypothetical protein